jgi:hypothetical protein
MSIQTNKAVLFDRAQQLADSGSVDAALDLLYEHFDELLLAGNFSEVSALLGEFEPATHSTPVLLTILTVTFPARSKLSRSRIDVFTKIERTLRARGEAADELLAGLE